MGIDPTIAVLYAQTNFAARFSHEAAVAPQTASTMSRMMAEEMTRQEQAQVQKMEKGGEVLVGKDGGHGGQGNFGSRRKNRQWAPPPEEEQEEVSNNPLLGNLLNVKV